MPQITTKFDVGQEVFYVDQYKNPGKGIIASIELRENSISYIINDDRIPENDTFEEIETLKTETVSKITEEYNDLKNSIESISEETFAEHVPETKEEHIDNKIEEQIY